MITWIAWLEKFAGGYGGGMAGGIPSTNTTPLRKTFKEMDRVVVFIISMELKVGKYRPKAYNMWKKMKMIGFGPSNHIRI